jgi:anhydro-N-acetylmuramic acid kinase
MPAALETSDRHGIDSQLVEAMAFGWLAKQAVDGKAGNLPSVTGARTARVLGAIYPG